MSATPPMHDKLYQLFFVVLMIELIAVHKFLLGHTLNALVKMTKNNKVRLSCAKFISNLTVPSKVLMIPLEIIK